MALLQAVGVTGSSGGVINSGAGWVASSAGSTIIVLVSNTNGTDTGTVTDDKSNTYTLVTGMSLWYCINATAGVTTITVASDAAAHTVVQAFEEGSVNAGALEWNSGAQFFWRDLPRKP